LSISTDLYKYYYKYEKEVDVKAQLKCSNCGAEIENLNFSWGRKQWLWFIPVMVFIFFLPFVMDYVVGDGKHDFRTELTAKETERRFMNGTIEILGVVENHGKVNWENIVVQADIYGKNKKFLDQLSTKTSANLLPSSSEHFKISSKEFPEARWKDIEDIKVKVSDAYHSKY
jgi:hypothetical protein